MLVETKSERLQSLRHQLGIGTLTPQAVQEQPLQSLLQEQEEQEQGDMLVMWRVGLVGMCLDM